MIVKRENIIRKYKHNSYYRRKVYKRTSYWLFGIIPLYIDNKIIECKE